VCCCVQVPLVTLVGASNELPESEELDALYDRFLIRKEVKQVTAGGEGTGWRRTWFDT
jgi:MoxR-like ATPase